MVRRFAFASCLVLAVAPFGTAQTPMTVTAEAIVHVTIKPDRAKIYLNVDSKAGDATSAVEVATTARKELVAAIEKLGLKGASLAALPQKITKDKISNIQLGGVGVGGAPPQGQPDSYSISQLVICTVVEADPARLGQAVEKITQTAAGQGITGDKPQAEGAVYNPFGGTTKNGARVVYSNDHGWDDATQLALRGATEKAMAKAKSLAAGAGLKVDGVLSVEEVAEAPPANQEADTNPYAKLMGLGGSTSAGNDEYADGELTRKVRVRVKVSVVK